MLGDNLSSSMEVLYLDVYHGNRGIAAGTKSYIQVEFTIQVGDFVCMNTYTPYCHKLERIALCLEK